MTESQRAALDRILTGDLPWVAEADLDAATVAELVAGGWLARWPEVRAVTLSPWAARALGVELVERIALVESEQVIAVVTWELAPVRDPATGRITRHRRRRIQHRRVTRRRPDHVPHWEPAGRPERSVRLLRERGRESLPAFWADRLTSREPDPSGEAEFREAVALRWSEVDPEWRPDDAEPVTLFGVPVMRTPGRGWHGAGTRRPP